MKKQTPIINCIITLLLLFFYVTGMHTVLGQGKVTVTYDKTNELVVIKNNEKFTIVFFPNAGKITQYNILDVNYSPDDFKFNQCGFVAPGFISPIMVEPGKERGILGVKKYSGPFNYYIIKTKYNIETTPYTQSLVQTPQDKSETTSSESHTIPSGSQATPPEPKTSQPTTQTSQPTTQTSQPATQTSQPAAQTTQPLPAPPTSSETKHEPKAQNEPVKSPTNASIRVTGKLTYTTEENVNITYRITGKKGNITWSKKNPPMGIQVNLNENVIIISGKCAQEGDYMYTLTVYGENGGRDEIIMRTLEIRKAKTSALTKKTEPGKITQEEPERQLTDNAKESESDLTETEEYTNLEEFTEPETDIEETSRKVSNTSIYLLGILLSLFAAGIIFYMRSIIKNKQRKMIAQEMKNSGKSGLLIEEEVVETILYNVDLSDIRNKTDDAYYKIDMLSIHEDSSIRNVYFSRHAILDIYKFFSNFLKYDNKTKETGCFLVGRWEKEPNAPTLQYNITIEALVEPSNDAVYGEYVLNFGAKIGITLTFSLEDLCNKTGNEYVHTAWMHSHPGLGLFLSSQDLNVQSQLAHSNHPGRMLAIVIDSNSPDLQMALFAPKQNGTMNNDMDLKQTLSFEKLYQWTKKEKAQAISEFNHFSINILPQRGKANQALFTGAAIIGMDMAILSDDLGLRGYFYGSCQENEIILNDFKEMPNTDDNPVGCLLILPFFSYPEFLKTWLLRINPFEITIVYTINDENIHLLAKNEQNKYPESIDRMSSVSLMKLKEWTRRKR